MTLKFFINNWKYVGVTRNLKSKGFKLVTYTKDFSWKKDPNLPYFEEKKFKSSDFYDKFQ
jgi:hypothetical protein